MDDFERLFSSFKTAAFRLELLPQYKIEGEEWEEYLSFVDGEYLPKKANLDWIEDIRRWTSEGKKVIRVRVLPAMLNKYIMYELNWCYPFNLEAGEDIRFISENDFAALAKDGIVKEDFWLFDDSEVLTMHYSSEGSYINESLVTAQDKVQRFIEVSNQLKKHAIPGKQFLSSLRSSLIPYPSTDTNK